MIRISNEDLYINAGDEAVLVLDIENDATGEDYILNSNQRLSLEVRRGNCKIFEIFSGYGENGILLRHEDTAKLSGRYEMSLKLHHDDGSVYTLVGESPTSKAHFYVMGG